MSQIAKPRSFPMNSVSDTFMRYIFSRKSIAVFYFLKCNNGNQNVPSFPCLSYFSTAESLGSETEQWNFIPSHMAAGNQLASLIGPLSTRATNSSFKYLLFFFQPPLSYVIFLYSQNLRFFLSTFPISTKKKLFSIKPF